MMHYDSDDVALALKDAPIDPRTGNKVLYNVSWIATNNSMIGERNEDWVRRELAWFNTGSASLSDMEAPVPQAFQACAGWDGKVNSAYGHILFGQGEELPPQPTLFNRVVDTFMMEGKGTRHAVAIISDRDIHNLATKNGRKDFICTNALNFMIDHEDRLHIIAQMRSMDAVWGYRADYSMWDDVMEQLLGALSLAYPEVKRGNITFQVANLHVYPRHFDLLDKWADRIYDAQEAEMRKVWANRASANPHANEPVGTGEAAQPVLEGLEEL
ncbi:thymidylate synthase [Microbacterium phage PrincePhergus]|uniref:Thymidylate synthase n=1 Tax=Microbacterium phage PrincePhergus TaxID=2562193 RepID=A0A4D6E2S7_9CAUD|nr:thymidylate synthase [Microbacterium phage PrincePhergus]